MILSLDQSGGWWLLGGYMPPVFCANSSYGATFAILGDNLLILSVSAFHGFTFVSHWIHHEFTMDSQLHVLPVLHGASCKTTAIADATGRAPPQMRLSHNACTVSGRPHPVAARFCNWLELQDSHSADCLSTTS